MSKATAVNLLSLKIERPIEAILHTIALPKELKIFLFRLDEKKCRLEGKSFNKDYYCLNTKTLMKCLESYFGLCDMQTVRYKSDDSCWLTFTHPVDVIKIRAIVLSWIEDEYSGPDFIEDINVLRDSVTSFLNFDVNRENVLLADKDGVKDERAYQALPLILSSLVVGKTVTVDGVSAELFRSAKNEFVTEPLAFSNSNGKDKFSFVIRLKLETLPSSKEVMLNVHISSRRWISRYSLFKDSMDDPKKDKLPFIDGRKTVYRRLPNHFLQGFSVSFVENEFRWNNLDKQCMRIVYGIDVLPEFKDIIANPKQFMCGKEGDFYIPFEYGMTTSGAQMHSQKSGITHSDRQCLFDFLLDVLGAYCTCFDKAVNSFGNCDKGKRLFDSDLKTISGIEATFDQMKTALLNNQQPNFEIAYSVKTLKFVDKFRECLKNAFPESDIKAYPVDKLIECLDDVDEKSSRNYKGIDKRIGEVKDLFKPVDTPTVTYFVIHSKDFYGKERVDPKSAIRKALLDTGRLSQFVTQESFFKKKIMDDEIVETVVTSVDSIIKDTILDGLRQLGFHLPLKIGKKDGNHQYVGVYVLKNLCGYKASKIKMLPLAITFDPGKFTLWVDTRICVTDRDNSKRFIGISCSYWRFPFELSSVLNNDKGLRLSGDETFLFDWFNSWKADKRRIVICTSDIYTRKFIGGISNKELLLTADCGHREIELTNGKKVDLYNTNVDLIRMRVNDEVPEYIPELNSKGDKYCDNSGLYEFNGVYYSKVGKPNEKEDSVNHLDNTKVNSNFAYLHRRLYEIYPVFVNDEKDLIRDLKAVHSLRNCNIQFAGQNTILPMPLHMAMKLEEYF